MLPPKIPGSFEDFLDQVSLVNRKTPSSIVLVESNLLLYVSRLTLLIYICGRPKSQPIISGRTKLAKIDFFVRYPEYLIRAVNIIQYEISNSQAELLLHRDSGDKQMIRYKYGPWDRKYYIALAYLSGKKILDIQSVDGSDNFALSQRGEMFAQELLERQEFQSIVARCQVAGELFGDRKGWWIKDFIYSYFPDVARTPYNQPIPLIRGQ